MNAHTPTPWTVELHEDAPNTYSPYATILPIGAVIRWSAGYQDKATDAAMRAEAIAKCDHIVTACNAHAELVAALQEIDNRTRQPVSNSERMAIGAVARAALAKVTP